LVLADHDSTSEAHLSDLAQVLITQSHFPATKCGTIISTYGISEVVRSNNVDFAPGEILYSWVRWEKFSVVDESNLQYLQKVKHAIDPVYYLGPLGGPSQG
jgi:NADPH-dependent curcumin reductase CurA